MTLCTKCAQPAHASETDDRGRCLKCIIAANEIPLADLLLCAVCGTATLASQMVPAPPCRLCQIPHNPRCIACAAIVHATAAHVDAIVNQRIDDQAAIEMRELGVSFTWAQSDALGMERLKWLTTRLDLVIMLDAHGVIARRNV